MEGWIKLHRQINENEFWFSERFTRSQAWIDLLLLANHKPNTVYIRGNEIKTEIGELCWSQVSLAKRWKWNRKTVDKFLSSLKKREMLDIRKTRLTTIITIKNWVLYQGDGQQNGQQKDNRTDTNKNDKKKNKRVRKNPFSIENLPTGLNGELFLKTKFFFVTRSLRDELASKLNLSLTNEDFKIVLYKMESWLESNGARRDYKTFFINWLNKPEYKNTSEKVLEWK